MRSGDLNQESLINQMTSVDNFVIDNSPITDKYLKMYDANYTNYASCIYPTLLIV